MLADASRYATTQAAGGTAADQELLTTIAVTLATKTAEGQSSQRGAKVHHTKAGIPSPSPSFAEGPSAAGHAAYAVIWSSG
jgi:hypothetical protein